MESTTHAAQPASSSVEGALAGLGPDASWRWPEERWRQVVNKVRSGRCLTPATWPHGAQVAVALSFDVDQETLSLRDGKTSWRRFAISAIWSGQGGDTCRAVAMPGGTR